MGFWGVGVVEMARKCGVSYMPVPGKAPALERTTMPWAREI